jgi:integrase
VRFVGRTFLQTMFDSATKPLEKELISTCFLTGGRITEVLSLTKGDFRPDDEDPNNLVICDMIVVKRYEKVQKDTVTKWLCDGHCYRRWDKQPTPEEYQTHKIRTYQGWVTKPKADSREFVIHRKELFAPYLLNYIDSLSSLDDKLLPISYAKAYLICANAGRTASIKLMDSADERLRRLLPIHTPPHWFRAQRASYLGDIGLGERQLAQYFDWRSLDMTTKYSRASLREIGEKLSKHIGGSE